jgi:hypothetical protein
VTDNTTDFFDGLSEGTGAPTAVLKNVGDFVHGEVVKMFKRDYVKFGGTEPEKKADGSNKQQLVIVLQTTLRNWQNVVKVPKVDFADPNSAEKAPSEDDGTRAVYVPESSNIQFAIGRAVTAAQAKFEVGGTLGVKIANLKDTGKGNPLKEHEAVYTAKPAQTGAEFFGGAAQEAAPAASAPAAPAQQAPAAQPASTPAAAPAAPAAQDPWATPAASASEPPPF